VWNPTGLIVSLLVAASGAILVWAVTAEVTGLNLNAIGWILLLVGIASFLLTLVLWSPWPARPPQDAGPPPGPDDGVWDTGRTRRIERDEIVRSRVRR
jgi:hypothetical protein